MGLPYGGTFSAVGGFMFLGGSYFCGSGKPKYGGTFSAVMQNGGIFLAVGGFSFSSGSGFGGGGKPKYGGIFSAVMQYGGNLVAVGGFSFFGGNDFGGRRYYQNMAVNRHITGTAHQGGNFTAGKIPTTTLKN